MTNGEFLFHLVMPFGCGVFLGLFIWCYEFAFSRRALEEADGKLTRIQNVLAMLAQSKNLAQTEPDYKGACEVIAAVVEGENG